MPGTHKIDTIAVREIFLDEVSKTETWADALKELQELSGETERFGKRVWDLAQFVISQVATVTDMLEAGITSRDVPEADETLYDRVTLRYQERFGASTKPDA